LLHLLGGFACAHIVLPTITSLLSFFPGLIILIRRIRPKIALLLLDLLGGFACALIVLAITFLLSFFLGLCIIRRIRAVGTDIFLALELTLTFDRGFFRVRG